VPDTDPPRRILLLGDPVGHSFSAVFQNAAFEAVGLPLRYEALQVPPAELSNTIARMREDDGILGANVTIPHKLRVGANLDRVEGDAATLRAVNTIKKDGRALIGWNTDGAGFGRALDDAGYTGEAALILGAGGAARAVAAVLSSRGSALAIASRRAAQGRELCDLLQLKGAQMIAFDAIRPALARVGLIVNATPIGMDGTALPLDPAGLHAGHLVVDLLYNPPLTPLVRAARARGARAVNGLGMLLFQGAAAFEIWTGRSAPISVMRSALERAAGPIH
jgi:shikimate dehydrogenase